MYLDDVLVSKRFVRLIVLGVFEENFVHVGAGVLVQFVATAEDYESYFAVA